jgi:hypothetical protein
MQDHRFLLALVFFVLVAYTNPHGKEAYKNGYAAQLSNLSGSSYMLPLFRQLGSHADD